MRAVFFDTSYFIGLLDPRDDLHSICAIAVSVFEIDRFVTTDLVVAEVLNHFTGVGPNMRRAAAQTMGALLRNPRAEVIAPSRPLLTSAISLSLDSPDKSWSVTDCLSFLVMRRRGIRDALTHDRHFVQAGLRALLRR
jgi:predicted nucleic acid-binding protein